MHSKKFFGLSKSLIYDFYVFTQVMLCHFIFAMFTLMKPFWPAKSYKNMLFHFTDFVAQNFTAQKKSFGMEGGERNDG
jgi:hypothetical protein